MRKLNMVLAGMLLVGALAGCGGNEKAIENKEVEEPKVTENYVVEEPIEEAEVEVPEVKEYNPQELANTLINALAEKGMIDDCYLDDQGYLVQIYMYNGSYIEEWSEEETADVEVMVTVAKQGITYLEVMDYDYDGDDTNELLALFEEILTAYGMEEAEVQEMLDALYDTSFVTDADLDMNGFWGFSSVFNTGGLSSIYLEQAMEL